MQCSPPTRRLRIAQVAPLYERVPPRLYGGTERVVSYLTEALVRLGHDVTLFASADSITSARLVPQSSGALRFDPWCEDALAHHVRMLGQVYRRAAEFDLIHCHTDYLGLPLASLVSTPTVLTLHGRLDVADLAPLYAQHPETPLVSISDAQRAPTRRGDYLLFLGRISPEKGPETAIRVAKRAGVPLRIAAKIDPVDRHYFAEHVRPLLDPPLIEFVGEVDERRKRDLLGGARALLFPIDWPEPFGLVMIEALASGTPVIARPRGSVPEILEHGVTGLVAEDDDALVDAVKQVGDLDRAACRAAYERRFTDSAMAARYAAVYAAIRAERARAAGRTSSPLGVGRSMPYERPLVHR